MKKYFIALVLIVFAAVAGVLRLDLFKTGEAREEIHKSFTLSDGAHVEISGINGPVKIETAEGNIAEVNITSTARSQDALDNGRIDVEQQSGGLFITSEKQKSRSFWSWIRDGRVKREVTMKLPRNIDFVASSINGRFKLGDVAGSVKISSVNGKIEVAESGAYTEISDVNGGITIPVTSLGDRGITITDVNGSIDLLIPGSLNAELTVSGLNGKVHSEIPDVPVEGISEHSKYNVRIGTGGAPIAILGINGSVRLKRSSIS